MKHLTKNFMKQIDEYENTVKSGINDVRKSYQFKQNEIIISKVIQNTDKISDTLPVPIDFDELLYKKITKIISGIPMSIVFDDCRISIMDYFILQNEYSADSEATLIACELYKRNDVYDLHLLLKQNEDYKYFTVCGKNITVD